MDFFNKLGDTIMSTTQDVADKAKGMTDVAKLQYEKKTKEDFLNKKYQEIGRMYYESNKDAFDEQYTELFKEVASTIEKIEEIKNEIAGKKGASACPKCGAMVASGAAFCSSCGAKMNDIFEEEDVEESAFEEEVEKVDAEVVED